MIAKQADEAGGLDQILQTVQRVMDLRGYLVISTFETCTVGQVLDDIDWAANSGDHDIRRCKFAVIGQTDREDHREQARIAGWTRYENPHLLPNYYRVKAE